MGRYKAIKRPIKNKMKKISIIALFSASIASVLIIIFVFKSMPVNANVSVFPPSITLSGVTATSTLTTIAAGVGTTTLVYDAYNTGQPFAASGAVLFVQDTASSTAAVLNIIFQYSQNGNDWYSDSINVPATTTFPFNLNGSASYRYTAPASASTTGFAVGFLTPTRYVRAVISATGATSSIFAQVTPRREIVQ